MKNAYTLNFWYGSNYGATLTSYALYRILNQLNFKPYLVNNMNALEEVVQDKMFSQKFLKDFNITKNINSYNNLKQINSSKDVFLTGSDQVFRPYLTGDKLSQFLLDFTDENSLKIAISASFGVNKEQFLKETSPEIIAKMKKSFESFDAISVREKSGIEICKELFDIDAELIIDPVFMIDKQNYTDIAKKSKKDYSNTITTYIFSKDKQYKNIYKNFEKKYNTKIVELAFKNVVLEDWLSAILNSKFVITDSFHGICFCLIFNKPFICPANGMAAYTRFESLFEMLNIENQTVSAGEILNKDCIFDVDWNTVNEIIKLQKEKGISYLKKVIDLNSNHKDLKKELKNEYIEETLCKLDKNTKILKMLKTKIWNKWLRIYTFLPKSIKKILKFIKKVFV